MEKNYTKVPNAFFDIEGLTVYERLILLYVIRKTSGFNKMSDGISLSQFVKFTGASKPTIVKSIDNLKKMKLLKVQKQKLSNGAKHFNRYTPLVKEINKGSKGDLLGLVKEVYIQKENNTKEKINSYFSNFFLGDDNIGDIEKLFSEFLDFIASKKNGDIGYRSAIGQNLINGDSRTVSNFQEWHMEEVANELNSKYSTYPRYMINECAVNKIEYIPKDKMCVIMAKDHKGRKIVFDRSLELKDYLQKAVRDDQAI